MGRAHHVLQPEEWAVLGRFGLEHIQCGAANLAADDGFGQRRLVDQTAARAVDDAHTTFALSQRLARQDVARRIRHRRVQRNEIGAGQQLVQFQLLHTHIQRTLFGQVWVVGHHTHVQPVGTVGDDGADIAGADQAEHLAGQLGAHEAVFLPLSGLGRSRRPPESAWPGQTSLQSRARPW